ncbi:hypothetical protein ACJMK2_031341 [Sinanodonta woodiana]|uniref:Uncharacterized protein n=1 Tax=Sinanodonta woodiana TaxID=1069815 RepID=A0ABD3WYH2_SINWO
MYDGKGVDEPPEVRPRKRSLPECLAICWTASIFYLCVIVVLILVGLGIAKIVIGASYIHECKLQTMIPIFLIISGLAPVFSGGGARRNKENKNTAATLCVSIGLFFNIGWTIAGSVWVYPTWNMIKKGSKLQCATNTTNTTTICKSCNDVVLNFAFAMVTVDWVVIGLVIIVITCWICATIRK